MKTFLLLCIALFAGFFIYLKQDTRTESFIVTVPVDEEITLEELDRGVAVAISTEEDVFVTKLVEEPILTPMRIVESFNLVKSELITRSVLEAVDEWQPTEKALKYWVIEHRLNQIKHLKSKYVKSLLGESAAEWSMYLGYDGTLFESLPLWPVEADVDRMWEDETTKECFFRALEAMHLASIADEQLWVALKRLQAGYNEDEDGDWDAFRDADLKYTTYRQLRDELWDNEARWWAKLWQSGDPSGYPHWPFLMTVADLHLN